MRTPGAGSSRARCSPALAVAPSPSDAPASASGRRTASAHARFTDPASRRETLPEPPLSDLDQRWIKALSHPARVGILQHFLERGGNASPKDLAEALRQPLPRISYHMRFLSDAGQLTLTRRMARGSTVAHFYRLANPTATADALRRLGIAGPEPTVSARPLAPEWVVLQRALTELRARREAQGLSRDALARKVGITPTYLGSVERGEADPRYTLLADLTRELGTTIAEAFSRAESIAPR